MELPGRRISTKVPSYLERILIPMLLLTATLAGPFAYKSFTKQVLNQEVILTWVGVVIFLLVIYFLFFHQSEPGIFVEASIDNDGLWVYDGKTKSLLRWKNILLISADLAQFKKGRPLLLIQLEGRPEIYKIFLYVEKGQPRSPNPLDYPDILTVAAKAPEARVNFKIPHRPAFLRVSQVKSPQVKSLRGRFVFLFFVALMLVLAYVALALGAIFSPANQKSFDQSECQFYSKKESELTRFQLEMRKLKLILHTPEEVESYRLSACTRASLNLP